MCSSTARLLNLVLTKAVFQFFRLTVYTPGMQVQCDILFLIQELFICSNPTLETLEKDLEFDQCQQ